MTETAVAVIQPDAIRHNLERIRSAATGCRIMAVLKANAYGHGLISVARLLDDVDALGVARLGEAIRLREAGIANRIVLLEGCINAAEMNAAVEHDLDVVVHDAIHFDLLQGLTSDQQVNVWLKVDTGMGRLGFPSGQLQDRLAQLHQLASVRSGIKVMTHLACADDPDSPVTMEQVRRFGAALGQYEGDISIANSAGSLIWPPTLEPSPMLDYSGENWVRPGLALFGASPVLGKSARELGLEAAMSFESRLISVKTIAKGATVGYGGDWKAERETVVGVIAAGYGDGYPRSLTAGTPVLVRGRRVALIGRVSMDMINVDLTDVPIAEVGDRVTLWGGHLPVEEVAMRAGTIPYELMCGLSQRVKYRVAKTTVADDSPATAD